MMKDLNIKADTINLLEENVGEKHLDTGLDDAFFGYDMTSTNSKSKNQQIRLYQIKSICKAKETQQHEKTTHRVGEIFCKP